MPSGYYPSRRRNLPYGNTPYHELPNGGRDLAPIRQPDVHGSVGLPGTRSSWFNYDPDNGINRNTDHWYGRGGQWNRYRSPYMGGRGWGWGPR